MNSKSTSFLTLLIFLKVHINDGLRKENTNILQIKPLTIASQAGESANFICTNPEGTEGIVQWSRNNTNISSTNDSRINAKDGNLSIESVTESDAGDYVCTNINTSDTGTGHLKIYVMPSYFNEAMIVIGINVGLLLIFLICVAWTKFLRQKQKKEHRKHLMY